MSCFHFLSDYGKKKMQDIKSTIFPKFKNLHLKNLHLREQFGSVKYIHIAVQQTLRPSCLSKLKLRPC